jgi:hypothetical protein
MKIESTIAWSCNGGETICIQRPLSCLHPPSKDCKPVRIYPEATARLLERAARLILQDNPDLDDPCSHWRQAWANEMKGKVRG